MDWKEAEFGLESPREAALGQANILAQQGSSLSIYNIFTNGLAGLIYAVIYVGDRIR